jgi:hypothetical protein
MENRWFFGNSVGNFSAMVAEKRARNPQCLSSWLVLSRTRMPAVKVVDIFTQQL